MMLIPTALEVDGMIRKIPRGQVSTLAEIRKRLARWHDVDVTCPLVTGIFLRIVAEAAEEDRLAGKSEITPYWRVVSKDGRLNAKFPGGADARPSTCVRKGTPSSTDEAHWKRQPLPRLEIVWVIMTIITL
jgi:alkylated DNA nucleotide flippase Atl1